MIPATETFDGTYPFAPHFTDAPGFRMHYVDEGPRDASPVVLLHGEPTWGYLYRKFIPPLSQQHRVIVPDHMGFGKSETPADKDYTLATHVDNVERLLLELDVRDITLVLHDWGGPIGGGFALRHPDRMRRLFLLNSVVPLGTPTEAQLLPKNNTESAWFRWVRAAAADGTLEEVLSNANHTILHIMKELQGFENMAAVDETWIRAYASHFSTKAECRGIINFPLDIVTGRSAQFHAGGPEASALLRRKPAMLAMGMGDRALFPHYFIPVFHDAFPGGTVVELEHAGHFCQEDQPEALVALIEQFIALTS